ncbi:DMP19 family protein [Prevotella sp. kh1p2]|uniref:DMP19 family protein n=1 Tax=Prevotella sp. kh1p2 TaxID=1761883 RepID=UPI0008C54FAA|nr:DMP19 family protein [Prevotella sp. kh1p2]SES98936.1 protein of unknown function [Prevotella sp. kh1p2]SNU11501.1 protein of unknown function [Prevotellaceae bacterium KH2P17]
MKEVKIKDSALQQAAAKGMDEFVQVFVDAIYEAIGGELNADTMTQLNADQLTLLGYHALREEVMDGGFVQLIHNGWGEFIYLNPFAKAVRAWGLQDLYRLISKSHIYFARHHEDIEKDCSDEEFMALFEKYPEFDDFDDAFVEGEERYTEQIAHYIDEHIDSFATIEK